MFATEHNDHNEQAHHTPAAVQAKGNGSSAHDHYEQEADDVAGSIMQMPATALSAGSESIQRKCAHCEEEMAMRKPITPFVQTKAGSAMHTSGALSNSISNSRGGGDKMDTATRSFMESRFGSDFSGVNIHTGNEPAMMNRELDAKAFTVGNDIYFNEGEYNPHSTEGKQLLAHELTHTIQQNGGQQGIQKQQAARPRRRILWLNIGFDSSATANSRTMRRLNASIATLRSSLTNCCTARNKACDVDVQPLYDWNRRNKPAPTDNDYDSDIAADRTLLNNNIDNIDTGRAGGLRLLVTASNLSQTWQGVRIFANANTSGTRIAWNVDAPNETIAHETGHSAGYNGGDIEGNDHSSDPNNLMSRGNIRNAGALPDANWCDHVAALAV